MFRVILIFFALVGSADAQQFYVSATGQPSGQIMQNLGSSDNADLFLNYIKNMNEFNLHGNLPTALNGDGYPIASLANLLSWHFTATNPSNYTWHLRWTGQLGASSGAHAFDFGSGFQVLASGMTDPQHCYSGGTGGYFGGTNCDVTFSVQTSLGTSVDVLVRLEAGQTTSSFANLSLIRSKDEAAFQSGQLYTPEALSTLLQQNPAAIRPMGLMFPLPQDLAFMAKWKYRRPITSISYSDTYFLPNVWTSQDTTNTDQYALSSYTDMPGSWTDGEMFQGGIVHASHPGVSITGAADNGSGLVRLTVNTTNISTNQNIYVLEAQAAQSPIGTLGPSQWVATVIDGTHLDLQGSAFASSSFTGSVSGTALTVPGAVTGTIQPGQYLTGSGVVSGTYVVSGGGTSWVLSKNNGTIVSQAFETTTWTPTGGGGAQVVTTTVNVGSRGAKFVLPFDLNSQIGFEANGFPTMVYDAALDAVLFDATFPNATGGQNGLQSMNIEAMAALANMINKPLWFNIPPFWQTTDVASALQYFSSALNHDLYLEYGNEVWNFGASGVPPAQYSFLRSGALGIPTNSNSWLSVPALKERQLLGAARANWSRPASQLHRVITGATHAIGSPSGVYDPILLQGQYLANSWSLTTSAATLSGPTLTFGSAVVGPFAGPTLTVADTTNPASIAAGTMINSVSGSTITLSAAVAGVVSSGDTIVITNPTYTSKVGTSYNSNPNRPIDVADAPEITTYFNGDQMNGNNGGLPVTLAQMTGSCNGTTCTGVIAAATCYATPNSANCGTNGSQQTALNFVDCNSRGTLAQTCGGYADGTVCGVQCSSLQELAGVGGAWPAWNATAAGYSLPLIPYEGSLSNVGPTAGYLAGLGDSNSVADAANIASLIVAYRNSALAYQLMIDWTAAWQRYSQTASSFNTTLVVQFGDDFSLLPGSWIPPTIGGTAPPNPYQLWLGVKKANGGFLLKRDLSPASNDNSPVGLNETA